jgi:1-acyl-sn-glycerol-3-phosphate acyltransferase
VVGLWLRLFWRVKVHNAQHVPKSGAVILAANHIGVLDGPALIAFTRRLTFALVKREAFTGAVGQFLSYVGQISVNRREIDPQAIRRAIQVLRAGKVLAVFPEGARSGGEVAWAKGGAAYLAMVSGAPIVPVQFSALENRGSIRIKCLACGDRSGWSTASHSQCPDLPGRAVRQQLHSGPRSCGNASPIMLSQRRL